MLTELQVLSLNGNSFPVFPKEIFELRTLKKLSMQNCGLKIIPEWQPLILEELDFTNNHLDQLPPSFKGCVFLTSLKLGCNKLTSLDTWMGHFTQLKILDLHSNELTDLSSKIEVLTQLETLEISSNRFLTALPKEIGALTSLTTIEANYCSIKMLPEEFGALQNLTHASFRGCNLTELPKSIGKLQKLTVFDLRSNSLHSLPPQFGDLSKLKELHLDEKIPHIPHLAIPPHLLTGWHGVTTRVNREIQQILK